MENDFWWFLLPRNGLVQQRQENSHPGVGFVHRCRFHRQDWSKTWRNVSFLAAWISCFAVFDFYRLITIKSRCLFGICFRNFTQKNIVNVTMSQKFTARSLKLLRAFEMLFSLVEKSWATQPQEWKTPLPCSHHRRIVPPSLILLQLVVCALYLFFGPRDPKGERGKVSCGKFPVGKLLTLKTKWGGSVVESGGFGGREVFVMSKWATRWGGWMPTSKVSSSCWYVIQIRFWCLWIVNWCMVCGLFFDLHVVAQSSWKQDLVAMMQSHPKTMSDMLDRFSFLD